MLRALNGGTEMLAAIEFAQRPRDPAKLAFWRGWWLSGLAGVTAAGLFEFWPNPFHGRLEFSEPGVVTREFTISPCDSGGGPTRLAPS